MALAEEEHPAARRSYERRILWVSLALSAAVHALAFGLTFGSSPGVDDQGPGPQSTPFPIPRGIRSYRIVVRDSERPVRAPEPEISEPDQVLTAPPEPEARPGEVALPGPPEPSPPRADNASDALTEGLRNPLPWRQLSDSLPDLWGTRLRLSDDIRAYNDERVGIELSDNWAFDSWTAVDEDGDRWGLAAGTLYLGGVVIPLCMGRQTDASDCGFGISAFRREEYRERLEVLKGLQQQEDWAHFRDRAAEIRKRRNAERDTVPPH